MFKMRFPFSVMLFFAMLTSVVVGGVVPHGPSRPFTLPIAARATEQSRDGKGWLESGVMTVPFVQAEGSFKSAMAQSGWKFRHAISLSGRDRGTHTLYTWQRGGNELTLMLRRIDVSRTAFSWGLAKAGK